MNRDSEPPSAPASELAPASGGELPAVAPAPTLVVDALGKRYEDTLALRELSFTVPPGEVLGLVGPNGAGKTTTLRTIAGVLPIQSGRVTVCGHDVAKEAEAAKRQLGWVPDDPEPFDTLTVEEHLEFTAELYRVEGWRARADELLARFELEEKRHALGGELSRGMRQKLAFSCTWLSRPRLVLLDEPLSGLDPRGIRSAKLAIRELAAAGTSVLLSSHLLELIEELADRLLILDRGACIFLGTLDEARTNLAPGESLEEIFFAATEPRPVPVDEKAPAAAAETLEEAAEDEVRG